MDQKSKFKMIGDVLKKCPMEDCSYSTNNSGHLQMHLITHSSERPFECKICGHAFKRKDALDRHQRIHMKLKQQAKFLHICPYTTCNFKTLHQRNLKRHIKKHPSEKPFKCTKCSYSCSTSKLFGEHKKQHLKANKKWLRFGAVVLLQPLESSMIPVEHRYNCQTCDYKTNWKTKIANHVRRHRYKWQRCPFKGCDFSGYCYRLLKHLNTHWTKETPFSCSHCGFSASRKCFLKTHITRMHPQQLFVRKYCNLCSFSTLDIPEWESHQRNHLRCEIKNELDLEDMKLMLEDCDKEFKCKLCSFRSWSNELVARHNENVHSVPCVALYLFPLTCS